MPAEEQPFCNFSGVTASEDQKHVPLCWHLSCLRDPSVKHVQRGFSLLFMFLFF